MGNEKSAVVKVNDGSANNFNKKDNDWLLINQNGKVLARWQNGGLSDKFPKSEQELSLLGGPDDPHYYDKLFMGSDVIAEILVPDGVNSFPRFVHQAPVPLMRNVPKGLTREQTDILLSFLLLQNTKI